MTDDQGAPSRADRLKRVHDLINAGQLADAAHELSGLGDVGDSQGPDQASHVLAVLLLAVFGFGDMAAAKRLNPKLALGFRPDLRYRLALRQNDWRLAKRLRTQPGLSEDVIRDFHWSASHRMLWSNRRHCGMRLYHNRVLARNFTKMLPSWLRYQRFTQDEAELPYVLIEQGIGDALVHLAHFQHQKTRTDHVFFGLPKMRDLVARLAPNARFVDITDPSNAKAWSGTAVHAMADYMVAGFLKHHRLTIETPLFARQGRAGGRPLFGLSWRGGSGQNRRDERMVPLAYLLDMLPQHGAYVVLQHDLTEAEAALIARYPNVMRPHMVLKGASGQLLDLIGGLAGVISVDNTNLHIAGATGTPIFALMNPRFHWYFMPDGAAESLYPGAVTRAIGQARTDEIAAFMAEAAQHPAAPALNRASPPPILVTAPPRSRTSMVMGALHAGGLWTGQTIAATPDNPRGFFENRVLRETILKPGLTFAGYDRLGVRHLPPQHYDAPWPGLADQVTAALRQEGWDGQQIWGFKDPKLLLVWRQWAAAFPNALWVLPKRPDEEIVASCLKTSFMQRHSRQIGFWRNFVAVHRMREAALQAAQDNVIQVDVADWAEGRIAADHRDRLAAWGVDVAAMTAFLEEGLP